MVRKQDIFTAKNYLSADEIDTLNRLTIIFLETAKLRVKDRKDLTIDFWRENADRILALNDRKVLQSTGSVSNAQMEKVVLKTYEEFERRRRIADAASADMKDLEDLNRSIKSKRQKGD